MEILVFGQTLKRKDHDSVKELLSALLPQDVGIHVYTPYLSQMSEVMSIDKRIQSFDDASVFDSLKIDYVVSMGGDGTMLSAVTLIADRQIPLLGINLGRLGFLASIEKKFISQAIGHLLKGSYHIEDRTMMYLETTDDLFGNARFALNDFTLHKRDTSSMITIHTYINGDFLNSYWADGVIVSTPTGSTGYSLSCGGPIIFPNSGNFVITPVAPHNLNVRPIVISDTSVISFEIEGRSENFLCTLDSRFETVTSQHQLAVRKCDFGTRLVQLNNFSFLRTIHEKLTWGKDVRN